MAELTEEEKRLIEEVVQDTRSYLGSPGAMRTRMPAVALSVELQERTCACGRCPRKFKCLPTSLQRFASLDCAEIGAPYKKGARAALRPIPLDRHGEVSASELARILNVSYPTIGFWIKRGKISAVDPIAKFKRFDLDAVRAQLLDNV